MKKFYISIFTVVFLLTSFLSQGQTVYNSITSNPLNLTLDDPNFWVGAFPDVVCDNCTLNIFSNVSMVQEGSSSYVPNNCGTPCNFLNDIQVSNSTINVYGNTTLTINTYLQLFNTQVTLGNDPTSVQAIKINDQVDLSGTSSVQLANDHTSIDVNDIGAVTIVGPHDDIGNVGFKSPGIFAIIPPDVNGFDYTQVLNANGIGTSSNQYQPAPGVFHYILNCQPYVLNANTCADGLVFGPALTALDGVYGVIFGQATTLPVELVQFLASKNDDGSVKLSWSTSQEQNSNFYGIERSSSQSDWKNIGSVKAKGYASTTSNYSFTDKLPVDGNGYYRLKMVDLDGKYKYSKTVSVSSSDNNRPLVIYSNPFSDQIRMKVNVSRAQNLVITVSDMVGKTFISQTYHAQSGDNFVNLQPNAGSSGMYILRIHGDSYDQTVKLEKQ
jgi:hypothetical protein